MAKTLSWLSDKSLDFPPLDSALTDPNGLLAVGGDLSADRLINAYQHGIFPWFNRGEAILWWSPSPRAIIDFSLFKINKTLSKFLRKTNYTVSINLRFDDVIDHCAEAPFRKQDTWIVDEMKNAYKYLHQLGYAHSIEVWQDEKLVGGLYGVAINGFFSGESMFYIATNASKVALVSLIALLRTQKIAFIDCQLTNPFLASMGATEIDREVFIEKQQLAINTPINQHIWCPRLLESQL